MAKRALVALVLAVSLLSLSLADEDVVVDEVQQEVITNEVIMNEEPAAAAEPAAPSLKDLRLDQGAYDLLSAEGHKTGGGVTMLGANLIHNVNVEDKQALEVIVEPTLDGEPAVPQQAMLMLTASSGAQAYLLMKGSKKDPTTLKASVNAAAVEKQLGKQGGKLKVTLLLADASAAKPIRWEMGTVVLPEQEGTLEPKVLTARNQPLSNALPEIHHMFRPADKRPPVPVSLAATAAAVAPLLVLLGMLASAGVNLKGVPTGITAVWAVAFHGGIAAMLGLYLLFWTQLNLATTLPLVAGLGLFIAFTGFKALSGLVEGRGSAKAVEKKTN